MSALMPGEGTDVIRVRGIRALGMHGVLPEERERGQLFTADVAVAVAPASGDDLATTVDYAQIAQRAREILAGDPCDLIETVAQRIADACLALPLVTAVEVEVHKPHAPVGVAVEDVSVHVVRERHG